MNSPLWTCDGCQAVNRSTQRYCELCGRERGLASNREERSRPAAMPPPFAIPERRELTAEEQQQLGALLADLHRRLTGPIRYQEPVPMAPRQGLVLPEEQPGDRDRLEARKTEAKERYLAWLEEQGLLRRSPAGQGSAGPTALDAEGTPKQCPAHRGA